jgi:hypothetical protein
VCAEENALDSAAVRGEVDLELLAGIEGEGGRRREKYAFGCHCCGCAGKVGEVR